MHQPASTNDPNAKSHGNRGCDERQATRSRVPSCRDACPRAHVHVCVFIKIRGLVTSRVCDTGALWLSAVGPVWAKHSVVWGATKLSE